MRMLVSSHFNIIIGLPNKALAKFIWSAKKIVVGDSFSKRFQSRTNFSHLGLKTGIRTSGHVFGVGLKPAIDEMHVMVPRERGMLEKVEDSMVFRRNHPHSY